MSLVLPDNEHISQGFLFRTALQVSYNLRVRRDGCLVVSSSAVLL